MNFGFSETIFLFNKKYNMYINVFEGWNIVQRDLFWCFIYKRYTYFNMIEKRN